MNFIIQWMSHGFVVTDANRILINNTPLPAKASQPAAHILALNVENGSRYGQSYY